MFSIADKSNVITLVANSPKLFLTPCRDYDWLVCTLWRHPGRGTATQAATRYSLTSWLTIPCGWHGVTPLHHGTSYSTAARAVHTVRRPCSHCGPTCWTLNPRSGQSYCSFNSHTNSNFALMKYILGAGGWTHSTKLYPNIKICFRDILE